eukprot:7834822-Lingulodinium_polyedra.AAC.1
MKDPPQSTSQGNDSVKEPPPPPLRFGRWRISLWDHTAVVVMRIWVPNQARPTRPSHLGHRHQDP